MAAVDEAYRDRSVVLFPFDVGHPVELGASHVADVMASYVGA